MKIEATNTATKEKASVEYNLGENLDEAIELFGADAIFHVFKQQAVIKIQGLMRSKLAAGKTPEEIQAAVSAYVVGAVNRTAGSKKPQKDVLLSAWAKMSDEERREVLLDLKTKESAA